ncbi:hypothetical protein DFH08DRAFT_978656 [Mycena albidolilacea]|uniref:Uncharacterized protein n=1 Tax=Mycena albidolilacea TaxID=1033008 RepID=A0AAD6YZ87_9AGAR|nr:hypothetical protein DFH08DRAFT_978656 [Mycena albidolilacea]
MNLCGYILWVASSSVELLSALAAKPLPLPDSRNGSLYSPPQPTAVTGPIVVASFLHTLRMIKRRFHGVRPCLVMHHDFPVILKETISEFGRCARLVIATLGFPNTLWASRISVMFSIIRIVPHDNRSKLRKITTGFAALFALLLDGPPCSKDPSLRVGQILATTALLFADVGVLATSVYRFFHKSADLDAMPTYNHSIDGAGEDPSDNSVAMNSTESSDQKKSSRSSA